jgi:hypothetical protein
MKTLRISLLTMVLLGAATSHSVPTADRTPNDEYATAQAAGPCYLINGIWVCED